MVAGGPLPPGRISVAVLSFNRREELAHTLEVLFRHANVWRDVVVADNASTDGSVEMVRSRYPGARLLPLRKNVGICASNLAYRVARADWVLSLDDDSHPDVETLVDVVPALDRRGVAAIALSIRRTSAGRVAASPIDTARGFSAAGVLLNRTAILELGGYDPELFLFTNELHWTARALAAGWAVQKCDSAVVVHRSSPTGRSRPRHAYHYCRNLLVFLARYAPVALRHELLVEYCSSVVRATARRRTLLYVRALRDGVRLTRRWPHKMRPLPASLFGEIAIDWRSPFAFV